MFRNVVTRSILTGKWWNFEFQVPRQLEVNPKVDLQRSFTSRHLPSKIRHYWSSWALSAVFASLNNTQTRRISKSTNDQFLFFLLYNHKTLVVLLPLSQFTISDFKTKTESLFSPATETPAPLRLLGLSTTVFSTDLRSHTSKLILIEYICALKKQESVKFLDVVSKAAWRAADPRFTFSLVGGCQGEMNLNAVCDCIGIHRIQTIKSWFS